MSTLAVLPELIGFFSYSREDDEGSKGALSALRDAIQGELSAQLGRTQADFRVWQDKTAISHGTLWENQIARGINQAVFFIPIVSPRALRSQHCIFEFESFLAREAELGREDLVFPILYIPVPELEDEKQWRQDPVLKIVGKRQYLDWRDLRPRGLHEPEVQTKIIHFCQNISNALRKPWLSIEERKAAGKADADARERAAAERMRQEEEAKRKAKQEQAFAGAKDADTVAAFSAFIATYPDSHLAGDAQNAKARLLARDQAHAGAMASDDPAVLESFLNSYPNGRHADEIRGRLRTLQLKADDGIRLAKQKEMRERAEQEQAFARAKDADTVAAFSAFIERYPKSHLAGDAQKEKARLLARDMPPPIEDAPKENAGTDPRMTVPEPSNITFRQVVCALLVLQAIWRLGAGINFTLVFSLSDKDIVPLILIFIGSAAGPIIVAFGIAWQTRWARVLGLIGAGIGVLFDGLFSSVGHSVVLRMIPPMLSVVIDVVVIIYLIRSYRPAPRAA